MTTRSLTSARPAPSLAMGRLDLVDADDVVADQIGRAPFHHGVHVHLLGVGRACT
jgi:hypothetical protein